MNSNEPNKQSTTMNTSQTPLANVPIAELLLKSPHQMSPEELHEFVQRLRSVKLSRTFADALGGGNPGRSDMFVIGHDVTVAITGKDRKVGAMVKALAVEVAGYKAVKDATKEFLHQNGHYVFHFSCADKAEEFRKIVRKYLSETLARVVD